MNELINPVRHGLLMAVIALICGALWAAYMATHHEALHQGFAEQEQSVQRTQMQHLMNDLSMEAIETESHHGTENHATHTHDIVETHDAAEHATDRQHSHTGSLATDAMQRLLRGHIHFMGLGVLAAVLLLITAFTSLKDCWKKALGWSIGVGTLAYPPAWIWMGFRTVELGSAGAEASVLWLFGPAVGLLLVSMLVLLFAMLVEGMKLNKQKLFSRVFD